MSCTFTLTGLSASEPSGESVFGPITITGTQVIGEKLAVPLVLGDNTFAIPTGSVAAWIQAPVNGSAVLKLRTSANPGDTGLPINGTGNPTIYPFALPAPTSLIVNSSASQTAPLTIAFI